MLTTNVCRICHKPNNGPWVIKTFASGKTLKVCKGCAQIEEEAPVISTDFQDKARERQEKERKEKNDEIIRRLKSNTYYGPRS